jgi:hypothetical protein
VVDLAVYTMHDCFALDEDARPPLAEVCGSSHGFYIAAAAVRASELLRVDDLEITTFGFYFAAGILTRAIWEEYERAGELNPDETAATFMLRPMAESLVLL